MAQGQLEVGLVVPMRRREGSGRDKRWFESGRLYTVKVHMDLRGGDGGDHKVDLWNRRKSRTRRRKGGRKRWDGDVIVVALSSLPMQRVRALHLSLSLNTSAWLLIASDTSVIVASNLISNSLRGTCL